MTYFSDISTLDMSAHLFCVQTIISFSIVLIVKCRLDHSPILTIWCRVLFSSAMRVDCIFDAYLNHCLVSHAPMPLPLLLNMLKRFQREREKNKFVNHFFRIDDMMLQGIRAAAILNMITRCRPIQTVSTGQWLWPV